MFLEEAKRLDLISQGSCTPCLPAEIQILSCEKGASAFKPAIVSKTCEIDQYSHTLKL